jgi:hypothetical protein
MKKYLIAFSLLTLIWTTPASAQIITGFGTAQTNPFNLATDLVGTNGNWVNTGSQNATSITITNAPNASTGSNGIFSILSTSKNITGNTGLLTLTGTLNSAPPTTNSFLISLFDSSSNELDYDFNWSSFSGGGSNGAAITTSLAGSVGIFNGTVVSWSLSPQGGPGDSSFVGFTFDQLAAGAVPEPSTYALIGLGLLGCCLHHHRRQKNPVRA